MRAAVIILWISLCLTTYTYASTFDKLIAQLKAEIENVEYEIAAYFISYDEIEKILIEMSEQSLVFVKNLKGNTHEYLEALAEKNPACVKIYQPQVDGVFAIGQENIRTCNVNGQEDLETIRKNMTDILEIIRDRCQTVIASAVACVEVWSPMDLFSCWKDQFDIIYENLNGLYTDIKTAFEINTEVNGIIPNVQKCLITAFSDFNRAVVSVAEKIENCIYGTAGQFQF